MQEQKSVKGQAGLLPTVIAIVLFMMIAVVVTFLGGRPKPSRWGWNRWGRRRGPPALFSIRLGGLDPETVWIDPEYTNEEKTAIKAFLKDQTLPLWMDDLKALPYRKDKGRHVRTSTHIGQRKLFVAELRLFATMKKSLPSNMVVVYAGAAMGRHIPLLIETLEGVGLTGEWHLYDKNEFHEDVRSAKLKSSIIIHEEFMDDAKAKSHKGCDVFISDIRSSDPGAKGKKVVSTAFETAVSKDMEDQARWHKIMAPKVGFLKFRLPYDRSDVKYLDGRIMLQAWAPVTSSETRLIVENTSEKKYDGKKYDDMLYWFNAVVREWGYYPPEVLGLAEEFAPIRDELEKLGVDWCYECANELLAWKEFVPVKKIPEMVKRLSEVSKDLRDPRIWPHGHYADGYAAHREEIYKEKANHPERKR